MAPQPSSCNNQAQLGILAMGFRGTRDDAPRRAIAAGCAETVRDLIKSCHWTEMPALEDQLPDECMPMEFLELWARRS